MGTPLYTTDIIPLTSRPTLTVMDDGDYFVILDTSTGKISKILKTNIMTALKITYDNTSGLTAETVQAALDELVVDLGSSDSAILALSGRLDTLEGSGYTEGSLKTHEDRLDTLEGTGAGSVADDIANYAVKLTRMPDGATAVSTTWSGNENPAVTLNGWAAYNCTLQIINGIIRCTATSTVGFGIVKNGTGLTLPFLRVMSRVKKISGSFTKTGATDNTGATQSSLVSTEWNTYQHTLSFNASGSIYVLAGTAGVSIGDVSEISGVTLVDYSYLDNSLATEASRIANQLGDTAGVGTKASGTITSNGTNVTDGKKVTIAGKVYTFKTVLGTTEGNVLIGGTAAESLDNLKLAINSTGVTAEQYCATFHPLVEATTNTDTVQTLQARATGILGNSITITTDEPTLTLSGSTLTGGTDDVGQKIYTQVKDIVAVGTRPAQADISDTSTIIGYENSVDVASGGTTTLPAGGTFRWAVYGYGATISSAKKGTSAGGTVLTVAGANATVWYRRIA